MSRPKLEVGMKLWFQASARYHDSREVTVLSIGRKWAQLDNRLRIDVTTWLADGGKYNSPGRCYESLEGWENEARLEAEWSSLRRHVSDKWSRPNGVTIEDMQKAAELLKVDF